MRAEISFSYFPFVSVRNRLIFFYVQHIHHTPAITATRSDIRTRAQLRVGIFVLSEKFNSCP